MPSTPVNAKARPMERPVNDLPPVVVALALVATVVELALSGAGAGLWGGQQGIGWRIAALEDYAFSPAVLDWIVTRGDVAPELLARFVTYPFVHASFTSALFGVALLLALGKFTGDVLHPVAMLVLFFGTAIAGALIYGAVFVGGLPLFGLWPPVYGLIGAYTYVIWLRLGQTGQNRMQAFRLIGFLLGLQLVFGLIFGANGHWVAELAGFAAGFALSPLLVPGGLRALRMRLRR